MEDRPEPAAPFEAVLYPNPAMPSRAIAVLFVAVAAVSMALGAAFAIAGAWPVTGFLGLDIVLLALAFRVCVRRSRCVASEAGAGRAETTGCCSYRGDACGAACGSVATWGTSAVSDSTIGMRKRSAGTSSRPSRRPATFPLASLSLPVSFRPSQRV